MRGHRHVLRGSGCQYGEVVEQTPGTLKLKVKRDRVIPVARRCSTNCP